LSVSEVADLAANPAPDAIVHVAPLRQVRHQEMMAHDELELRALVVVQVEPARNGQHHRGAALRVSAAVSLADVVEEDTEEHHLDVIDLAHHLRQQRHLVPVGAGAQPLELADAHERMLVDGIDVVEVVLRHAEKLAELGNVRTEHAELVHLPQCLDVGLPTQDVAEDTAPHARLAQSVVDQLHVLAELVAAALNRRGALRRGRG
jgi:hypothetical protein